MKKILLSLCAVVFAAIIFTSCGKNDPKAIAKEWLTDFYHQDYDAAKKLSTDETKAMLTTLQSFTGAFPDSVKQKAKQVTINIKDCKIEGDKATVSFIASNDPNADQKLHLKKINEKWLVQFSKNEPFDENGNKPATLTTEAPPEAAPATPDTGTGMPPDTAMKK